MTRPQLERYPRPLGGRFLDRPFRAGRFRQAPAAHRPLPVRRHRGRRRLPGPTAPTPTAIAGIMEHIEEARHPFRRFGLRAGCRPTRSSPRSSPRLAGRHASSLLALQVGGPDECPNMAIKDGDIYVLEVNPRGLAPQLPFVAKVVGIPVAKIAGADHGGRAGSRASISSLHNSIMSGSRKRSSRLPRFPGGRHRAGPGDEVDRRGPWGIDRSFEIAFAKSQLGGGSRLPRKGTVFVSVREADKDARIVGAV